MKILFAIKKLNDASGGAERVLCTVASALAARGHDVTIISFDREGGKSFYKLSHDVRRVCLGIGDAGARTRLTDFLRRVRALRRYLHRHAPDVAIGFMHSMFVPLSIAGWGGTVPVVASEHIAPAHYRTRPLQFIALLCSFLLVKRITILSRGMMLLYPPVLRGKMRVVPNPVRNVDVSPDVAQSKTILSIGRLEPQKAHHILIDAFARVAPEFPAWRVDIVGAGACYDALAARIAGHGLQARIKLHAPIRDIDAFYERAAIFATSARYEGFGLAVAEAMRCGLPVLAFADCAGVNELVKDGESGYLSACGTDAFADGLRALIGDARIRAAMGRAGKARIADYNLDASCDAWEKLCADIMG